MTTERGYLLLVDSDSTTFDLLNTSLEYDGYNVAVAENSQQALMMLQEQPFDLMLLSLELPDGDGLQLLRSLHSDQRYCSMPVIMLAKDSAIARIEQGLALGAEDYIGLPVHIEVARRRIRTYIQKYRTRSKDHLEYEREALALARREFEIGQQIQVEFLPKELPVLPGWEIGTPYYNPARQVGGDLYDVFEMTESGLIGLVIGDVCDKGVGAALFMTLFRSFFRAATQQCYPIGWPVQSSTQATMFPTVIDRQVAVLADSQAALKSAFELANNYVAYNHSSAGYFVTLFFGVLDPATGTLVYVNAGHMPPYLVGADGIKALLPATGPIVGIFPQATFGIKQITLAPGDTLFTYSDGVTDARDPKRQLFGAKRLCKLIEEPAPSATDLVRRVEACLSTHIANAEQYDDITMLAVRRLPELLLCPMV